MPPINVIVPIDVYGRLKGKEVLVRDNLGGERFGILRQWDDRIVELSAKGGRPIFIRRSGVLTIEEDGMGHPLLEAVRGR